MYTEMRRFHSRRDAGRRLADLVDIACGTMPDIGEHRSTPSATGRPPLVLGLPRGGVPVAAEVAARLHAPLHVLLARKLGAPAQPELALGAISEAGVRVVDPDLAARCGVTQDDIDLVERRERRRIEAQALTFGVDQRPSLRGRTVIIIDDGIATGATARAACRAARALGSSRTVLATPGAPRGWQHEFAAEADELVCVLEADVPAVSSWYVDFAQVSDDEVRALIGITDDESDDTGNDGATGD